MLEKDSSKRSTIDELNDHPFITHNGALPPPLGLSHEEELELIKNDKNVSSSESAKNNDEKGNHGVPPSANHMNKNNLAHLNNVEPKDMHKVWVITAIDYSVKLGLGYLLSNGHYGAHFNDGTKLLMNSSATKAIYYFYDEDEAPQTKRIDMSKIPKMFKKKCKILKGFQKIIEDEHSSLIPSPSDIFNDKIYVEKWLRTRNAFVFKFPHKVVQVLFTDSTEIRMVKKPSKIVSYVNKKKEVKYFNASEALESANSEFNKRLNYARKVTEELLAR